jgi:2-methylcitrate dehydratase PrpD
LCYLSGGFSVASSATESLTTFVLSTTLESVPQPVRETASKVIIDTIGVMLAGTTGDVAEPLHRYVRETSDGGPATIIGWGRSVPAGVAALANATLGHALDFDDVLTLYPGHPSAVVLGALFASVEPAAFTGADLLGAYVLGVEAGAKIGKAMGTGPYIRGWHTTSTTAIFSAILALARVRGLSQSQTLYAMGIGGSMAAGLRSNFGTMTKALHSGWAAQAAVTAIELAAVGWTANQQVLECEGGFVEVFGDERSSAEPIAGSLGNPYAFVEPGVGLKQYPCYYGVHRAIDAMREIAAQERLVPDDIERVTCVLPPGGVRAVLHPRPRTGLEGKFSIEYLLAATILDGTVGLRSFSDEAVRRPEVLALLERISVTEAPPVDGGVPGPPDSLAPSSKIDVEVSLRSGALRTASVAHAKGSPQCPLSWDDVIAKFRDCAQTAGVGPDVIERALKVWREPEEIADVRAEIASLFLP